ncbi:myrosinase 1-like [Aphidius gifuensis]|uniref:myrosinase 1-like n=1 Tax=Aphidius gifuensis TaxID=684658 RepID=UPI001CDB8B67|nr:myrosinase 1-like [Aphidius gifuensis]
MKLHFLQYLTIILLLLIIKKEQIIKACKYKKIPDGFKIGAATAAYQIEGGWNISDKGKNNWDEFTNSKSHLILDGSNGNNACNFYHKYKEDIQIIKNAKLNHFRLSLSWSRILPTGFADKISQEGVQYYKNVLDELHAQGIEPFVTINHFDIPHVIEKMGGWTNELIVDYFGDYARIVFQEFGSRVKFWSTINEPSILCESTYHLGVFPPGMKLRDIGMYICGHNVLKAHARAYRIYDEEFRKIQNGKISIVLNCNHYIPVNDNEIDSCKIAHGFDCDWFSHPIYSKNGDYPSIMKKKIYERSKSQGYLRSRLPEFSPYWIDYIKGTFDYFGLNHYVTRMTKSIEKNIQDDSGVVKLINETWETTGSNEKQVVPEGIGGILRKIKNDYNNPPVYILENGRAGCGNESDINDIDRIKYHYSYMKEVLLAVNRDGCNVKAYTVWSFMDNFEWARGYSERYGLVYVNFTDSNYTRIPRLSLSWFSHIIKNKKLINFEEFNSLNYV